MNNPLPPVDFVNRLLDREPVWHRAPHDQALVVDAVVATLNNADRLTRRKMLWLLDRLVPLDSPHLFEPYVAKSNLALYAWGRRLNNDERHRLTTVAKTRNEIAMIAWCETASDSELLQWENAWAATLPNIAWFVMSPEEEYFKRNGADKQFIERATGATPRPSRPFLDRWRQREAAGKAGPPSDPPPARESVDANDWANRYASLYYWTHRHGQQQWRELFNYVYATCDPPRFVLEHLSAIVPENEIEPWGFLRSPTELRAFCRWLTPRWNETLRPYFSHPDPEWRQCAYQCYLGNADHDYLRHLWRLSDTLPVWQVQLLDRKLHAPPRAQPPKLMPEYEAMSFDPRGLDPL